MTGQTPHQGEFAAARSFRDPSIEAQTRRYKGSLHESIMRQGANAFENEPSSEPVR